MARNRKRRRDGRPPDDPSSPGVATARPQRDRSFPSTGDLPGPVQHSSPDAEIAEAQLAAAEARAETPQLDPVDESRRTDEPFEEPDGDLGGGDEFEDEEPQVDDGGPAGEGPGPPRRRRRGGGDDDDSGGGLTPYSSAAPASAPRRRNGLLAFAQGSWRELQRVQWPDRQQVVQATGVVIGFVIVAGAYLGLADWVAGKIVHFILS